MVWCQMNQPQIGQSGAYERCRELLDRCSSALRTPGGAACACDRWAQADPDAVVAYRSRPKVCLYVPLEPMDRVAIPRHITVRWARQRVTAEGEALFLGAELASVGEVIGDVTLWFQSAERRPGEVGWMFNPDPSRQGYATEAVQRRLHLVFDQFGLHRVVARSTPATTPRSASRGWPPDQPGQSFMSSDELAVIVRSSN